MSRVAMLFPCLATAILGLLLLDHQQNHVHSFSMTPAAARWGKSTLVMNGASYSSESSSFSGSCGGDENSSRRTEFKDLEPLVQSAARRARLDRDMETKGHFAKYGNDLWNLRSTMKRLRAMLVDAVTISGGNREHEIDIRKRLRKLEQQDPELIYRMQMAKGLAAQRDGRMEDAEQYIRKALAARSCLPQYNLEGLWVGKYGHHGYEMINITYTGDQLVAYKVTGDKNVPKGEITFQADLSPLQPRVVGSSNDQNRGAMASSKQSEPLQPIFLTEKASKKWGTAQLPRYKGVGQVAESGFQNNQWMEGQLIIIGDEYFSFAWVPIEQQIFFGRPSPELALKMLRSSSAAFLSSQKTWDDPPSLNDDVSVLKNYVASCLDKTHETFEDEAHAGCIWSGGDAEECYFQ